MTTKTEELILNTIRTDKHLKTFTADMLSVILNKDRANISRILNSLENKDYLIKQRIGKSITYKLTSDVFVSDLKEITHNNIDIKLHTNNITHKKIEDPLLEETILHHPKNKIVDADSFYQYILSKDKIDAQKVKKFYRTFKKVIIPHLNDYLKIS